MLNKKSLIVLIPAILVLWYLYYNPKYIEYNSFQFIFLGSINMFLYRLLLKKNKIDKFKYFLIFQLFVLMLLILFKYTQFINTLLIIIIVSTFIFLTRKYYKDFQLFK